MRLRDRTNATTSAAAHLPRGRAAPAPLRAAFFLLLWNGIGVAFCGLVATTCMKYVALYGARWMWGGVIAGYLLCFSIFPIVLRSMPMSVAYALWSGIGTASSALIGAALFAEPLTRPKLLWTAMIVAGVCGLNFAA